LLEFCRDDIPNGLFTDQRWADHMPAMFEGVKILRSPAYNVATWNLSSRRATGRAPMGILINGEPLCFYHFSGFDSGAQETMLALYGRHSPVLFELRRWYIAECEAHGQSMLGQRPCVYSSFDNGQPITKAHRVLYRERGDLQQAFPNPFSTVDVNRSYWHWFQANSANELNQPGDEVKEQAALTVISAELDAARAELRSIRGSRAWKLARGISSLARAVRRP
jgi:hypothetical protein